MNLQLMGQFVEILAEHRWLGWRLLQLHLLLRKVLLRRIHVRERIIRIDFERHALSGWDVVILVTVPTMVFLLLRARLSTFLTADRLILLGSGDTCLCTVRIAIGRCALGLLLILFSVTLLLRTAGQCRRLTTTWLLLTFGGIATFLVRVQTWLSGCGTGRDTSAAMMMFTYVHKEFQRETNRWTQCLLFDPWLV